MLVHNSKCACKTSDIILIILHAALSTGTAETDKVQVRLMTNIVSLTMSALSDMSLNSNCRVDEPLGEMSSHHILCVQSFHGSFLWAAVSFPGLLAGVY